MANWKTGQVVRSRGVSRQQLYLYRVMGLITPAGQTETGRWVYDEATFAQLALIEELRRQGRTLQQIRTTLRPAGRPLASAGG